MVQREMHRLTQRPPSPTRVECVGHFSMPSRPASHDVTGPQATSEEPSHARSPEVCTGQASRTRDFWDAMVAAVRGVIADDVLTADEEAHLHGPSDILGTPGQELEKRDHKMSEETRDAGINDGRFPRVQNPGVKFKRGEDAYAPRAGTRLPDGSDRTRARMWTSCRVHALRLGAGTSTTSRGRRRALVQRMRVPDAWSTAKRHRLDDTHRDALGPRVAGTCARSSSSAGQTASRDIPQSLRGRCAVVGATLEAPPGCCVLLPTLPHVSQCSARSRLPRAPSAHASKAGPNT
jgi:hypothetical protein